MMLISNLHKHEPDKASDSRITITVLGSLVGLFNFALNNFHKHPCINNALYYTSILNKLAVNLRDVPRNYLNPIKSYKNIKLVIFRSTI